jgi:hypothetical protein
MTSVRIQEGQGKAVATANQTSPCKSCRHNRRKWGGNEVECARKPHITAAHQVRSCLEFAHPRRRKSKYK